MDFTACADCDFYLLSNKDFPCSDCKHCVGRREHFAPYYTDKSAENPPEQPTTPPMPTVNQPKTGEEINHPTRYAGGKYECIDVMTDVFGEEAVRNFCKLNAFKYLWREQRKNGVEDLQKASWYLDKLIELSQNTDENV